MTDEPTRATDDADRAMPAHWRNPPGWALVISRCFEIAVARATTVDDVHAHYAQIVGVTVEELPPSDQRTELLAKIANVTAMALRRLGGVRLH
jgi:hypothetical protein